MVNKYNAYGFLTGIVGTGLSFVLTLLAGGGLVVFADQEKYKDLGWGVIAGAGFSFVMLVAIATGIVINNAGTPLAAQASAFLTKNGIPVPSLNENRRGETVVAQRRNINLYPC